MRQVNIHEARTHLSQLVEDVARGEEIVIAKAGKPMARLVAVDSDTTPRLRGLLKGKIRIADDFDAPLPEDIFQPNLLEERTMNQSRATHFRWDDMPKETVNPTLSRRLISTERMMLAHVYLEKGTIVPRHAHENEQLTYVLEGKLRFWLGDNGSEVVDVGAGEVLHLPSHLPHKAEALEWTLDVDIFCPPRQDWLDQSDAYLRSG